MEEYQHVCYLCMQHEVLDDATTKLVNIGTYSSPPWLLTTKFGNVYSIIYQTEGKSYHEASEKMTKLVMNHPGFEWCRDWINPSFEAHQKRFEMRQKIKGERT